MIRFEDGAILYNDRVIIENIQLATEVNNENYKAVIKETVLSDNEVKILFTVEETGTVAELLMKKKENEILFWFSGKIVQKEVYLPIKTVDEECGYVLSLTTKTTDGVFARYMQDTCWSYASFNPYEIPQKTQSLLIKNENIHIACVPMCTEKFKTQIMSEKCNEIKIYMGAGEGGYTDNEGYILSVAICENPFKSVSKAIKGCQSLDRFETPLKKDKDVPMLLEGLGWCTWDACYFDVTHDKIISKVEELKQKNIKLNWVLIDDGWFEFEEKRLQSIYADKKKFPQGLSKTVQILKEEYGVKYVGVWHCFMGLLHDEYIDGYECKDGISKVTYSNGTILTYDEENDDISIKTADGRYYTKGGNTLVEGFKDGEYLGYTKDGKFEFAIPFEAEIETAFEIDFEGEKDKIVFNINDGKLSADLRPDTAFKIIICRG